MNKLENDQAKLDQLTSETQQRLNEIEAEARTKIQEAVEHGHFHHVLQLLPRAARQPGHVGFRRLQRLRGARQEEAPLSWIDEVCSLSNGNAQVESKHELVFDEERAADILVDRDEERVHQETQPFLQVV